MNGRWFSWVCVAPALLLRVTLIQGLCVLGLQTCGASAFGDETHAPFEKARTHFHTALEHTPQATLTFFWTTGVSLSDDPVYFPPKRVDVGGTPAYGAQFFPCVSALLENTPPHLRVRFVCDARTWATNDKALSRLRFFFPTRFFVVHVEGVIQNIRKAFPEDTQVLSSVFDNATRGNPAIASDIYRLVGMHFGHGKRPKGPVQHTYCDVDTFLHAMFCEEAPMFISALLGKSSLEEYWTSEALLSERQKNAPAFMMWRHHNISDVIKMHVADEAVYHAWCREILGKIDPKAPWLLGRTRLHDAIRHFEKNPDLKTFRQAASFDCAAPMDVINGTGPGFTGAGPHVVANLFYPSTSTWAWCGTQGLKMGTGPLGFLENPSLQDTPAGQSFMAACKDYVNVLSAALFAKKFGENHPFFCQALVALEEENPYVCHLDALYTLVWEDFARQESVRDKRAWQKKAFQAIAIPIIDMPRFYTYHRHMKQGLAKVGLPFQGICLEDLAPQGEVYQEEILTPVPPLTDDGVLCDDWDTEEDL